MKSLSFPLPRLFPFSPPSEVASRSRPCAPSRTLLRGGAQILAAACAAVASVRGAETSPAKPAAHEATATYPQVSDKACPAEIVSIRGNGGHDVTAIVRKPPGAGPFPAVVLLHGGLGSQSLDNLKRDALTRPTHARFLAAGYITITATFRSREADPQTRDALEDCLTVIAHVKKMREVDPRSVVIVGGSGGGSLALELAGETDLAAVAAGEPANILFTGMLTSGSGRSEGTMEMMNDPKRFYTPNLQQFTRRKIAMIRCPVFIGHGDQHAINQINHEIVIPELRDAGKEFEVVAYPGQPHGFYFGGNGDPKAGEKFFVDVHAFFQRSLPTKPAALEETLITRGPIPSRAAPREAKKGQPPGEPQREPASADSRRKERGSTGRKKTETP